MGDPVILLDHLSKHYGETRAVQELSLSIERGSIFGFLGANGAGKTTTIRMLCGLVRPSSGRAAISGLDVWRDRQRVRQKFGYVAQRFSDFYSHSAAVVTLRRTRAVVIPNGRSGNSSRPS